MLKLDSGPDGGLLAIQLNDQQVGRVEELQSKLVALKATGALEGVTMTIDAHARLWYQYVIDALDHVTAFRDSMGIERPLVTATRFASRRE